MYDSTRMGCARCGRTIDRAHYEVLSTGGTQKKCLRCAIIHPPLVRRALLTSLVVGTVLTSINQLDLILGQGLTPRVGLKVALTYVVPICVTTWGALTNARRKSPAKNA